ncbi:uncharacterized protein LOC143847870 [Tasmannia lanceolata]|uniref:uncharacterized protein LOC143847870 n=1 Tax=Tasmannia lanceolata TaxID=3420 RepID=UPI004064A49A
MASPSISSICNTPSLAPSHGNIEMRSSIEVECVSMPSHEEKGHHKWGTLGPGLDEYGVFLTWEDLWVTVSNGNAGNRGLLQGLTGYAQPGEVLAIMGPSGCGKSTLLDAFVGRLGSNTRQSGEILINGRKQTLAFGTSAYVTQDDALMTTLTVKEAVYYSAQLKLPNSMSKSEKKERAEMTISEMGLQDAANTRIGGWDSKGLSGGQKRRLSICIEILTRPKLLFLDEPTSGLDSAASYHVMSKIVGLAQHHRRTVIASIHQPCSEVFELFHNLCLLSSGRAVYFGPASEANEFFALNGFPCPLLRSPCDHYLRTINKDFDQDIEQGIGTKTATEAIDILVKSYKSSITHQQVSRWVAEICKMEGGSLEMKESQASFLTQCVVLTKRSFVNMYRDLGYYWLRLAIYLGISLCIGTIYTNIGYSFGSIQERGSMLIFISSFLTFMTIGGFPSFVEDMKIFGRERLNGHYGVSVFVIGNTFSAIPFLFLVSVIPGAVAYYLVGLQRSVEHFTYFALVLFVCMMLVESLMMMVASIVPNFLMGIITGAGIQGLMILSGGFFQLPNNLPKPFWRYPMYYIAFHKYANQGFYKNEYLGLTFPSNQAGGPHTITGDEILRNIWQVEMVYSKWVDLAILAGMVVLYRLMFLGIIKGIERVKPMIRALQSAPSKQAIQVQVMDHLSTPSHVESDIGRSVQVTANGVSLTWDNFWVKAMNGKSGSRVILEGITGYAQPGEVLAIMGPSGCGKSTLLDALADTKYFGSKAISNVFKFYHILSFKSLSLSLSFSSCLLVFTQVSMASPSISSICNTPSLPPSHGNIEMRSSIEVECVSMPSHEEKGHNKWDTIAPGSDEYGVFLTWEDLWVTVSNGNSGNRGLLQGLTGYAQPGEVLAIMGPSGCGKSTLLDAFVGRLGSNTRQSGEILINGRKQTLAFGTSAYVTQDDALMTTLTVKEAVYYSAQLKLPNSMSKSEKKERAEMTINEMGLQDAANTRIGGWDSKGLSGGQKRRLSICIEILTRPKLLFLDEPTSGLDSAASYHVMSKIVGLAQHHRRTVIASIHQPCSEVFELFHNLCLLSSGRAVYFGPASAANEFFALNGFPCPLLRSPCDHYLRTINKDFDQDIEQGIGTKTATKAIDILVKSYKSSITYQQVSRWVVEICKMEGGSLEMKEIQASFLTQCVVLTKRSFVNMYRDLGYYWLRLAIYVAISLCIGTIYTNIGYSFGSIQERGSMLIFISSFLTFMTIGGFPSFVEDMKIFGRERLNGHYGVSVFVIGNTFSAIPFLFLVSVIPGAVAYYLVGLQRSVEHFTYFALVLFVCMMLVESLMMMVASIVPNFLMGIITGAGIQGLMILSGGFFQLPNNLPKPFWRYPMYYIAFHKYANQGFYKNEYLGLTFPSNQAGGPHTITGDEILRNIWQVEMVYSKWVDLAILAGMVVLYRLMFLGIIKGIERVKPMIRALQSAPSKQAIQVQVMDHLSTPSHA